MSRHAQRATRGTVPARGSPATAPGYASAAPLPTTAAPEIQQNIRDHTGFPLSDTQLREWDRLATKVRATPYLYPGWVDAWWQAFGSGELDIRTLRRGGRLVGLLPMAWNRGILESAANYHTPEFGILAVDSEARRALTRELFADRPAHLSITSLDPSAETIDACRYGAEEAGYKVVIRDYQRSPYLDLDGTWGEYESGLGRN